MNPIQEYHPVDLLHLSSNGYDGQDGHREGEDGVDPPAVRRPPHRLM